MIEYIKIEKNGISYNKGLPPGFWRDDENLVIYAPNEYVCLFAGDSGGAFPGNDELDPLSGESWERIVTEMYKQQLNGQEAIKFINARSPQPFRQIIDISVDLSDDNYVYYERWIFGIPEEV